MALRFNLGMLAVLAVAAFGCGKKGLHLVPVSGTVKYSDGSVPTGEIRKVRFEPTVGSSGKPATGTIGSDGKYELMTLKPGDGALPGEYKVLLLVWKTYMGREPVLPPAYEKAATTPLPPVTVNPSGKNEFPFEIPLK